MAFPFPPNPTDGQVVSQAQPDGSVLVATYRAAKNEWTVDRQLPAPTPITGAPPIVVTASADGQVITWDQVLKTWVAKTPAAQSGGVGGTFVKATQAAADTSNPPSVGAKPLVAGMLQSTLENLHKEIKAWDGTTWTEVFGEDTIKQWISAGSLFRGVVKEATLGTLPAPATANRGFYYSWTGNPNYIVQATDPSIGTSLAGEILQVGDWVQSDGAKWVHVPGDLLSKQRWDSLGAFVPWSDTSWEKGALVSYQQGFWRANTSIVAGDDAPEVVPGNKWTDITPHPSIKLAELADVNDNVALQGQDGVLVWAEIDQEFVVSRTMQLDALEFDASGPGITLEGFMNGDLEANKNLTQQVPSCEAVTTYVDTRRLEDLDDTKSLSMAQDGEVPAWNATTNQWEPKLITSPIIYLGTGAWVAANVADATKKYGMAADTQPNPDSWPPVPGDQYIDLSTGNIIVFTGATGTGGSTHRSASSVTGGGSPGRDAIRETLNSLSDVDTTGFVNGSALVYDDIAASWKAKALAVASLIDVTLTGVADKQVLQYDLATTSWKNWTPDYLNPKNGYTKTEVDNKLTAIVTGLNHEAAVLAIADTPPAAPSIGQLYIVGATPTGVWVGQANNLSRWDGTAWQFDTPQDKEAHLVEAELATYGWSGTKWVKVAAANTTGSAGAGDIWQVGSIQQSMLTEPQWATLLGPVEGAKWVLADGRNCTGTKYEQITGKTNLPDLRGAFLRAAGQNRNGINRWNGGDVGQWFEDSTALPKTAFTTSSSGTHNHSITAGFYNHYGTGGGGLGMNDWSTYYEARTGQVSNAGAHTHTIGGGDIQTAPVHVAVNTFIKIN
jgi:hypothetical protein